MSKKEKRLESKKRKAEAFLRLVTEEKEELNTYEEVRKEIDEVNIEPQSKIPKIAETDIKKSGKTTTKVGEEDGSGDSALKNAANMAEAELARLRQVLKQRQKSAMEKPKVYLTLDDLAYQNGRLLSQEKIVPQLPPLFVLDMQHLALNSIQGNLCSYKPRWCRLLRPGKVSGVVVMVMEDVCVTDLEKYPECFQKVKSEFEMSVELVSPALYGSTVAEDLFHVPVSMHQMKALKVDKAKRSAYKTLLKRPDLTNTQQNDNISSYSEDSFPRTCLLLSTSQMLYEGYPVPFMSKQKQYENFVYSNAKYETVTTASPMFAIDCEMCITTAQKPELTRVSVVNERLETVYDKLVKPHNKITNYLTRFSGITKQLLEPVNTRLSDVQTDLRKLFPSDAILCGQSLNADLLALQLYHPYVIDTSVIYNLSGFRGKKTSLKALTQMFLGRDIQERDEGHCSTEDAKATMELVLHKLRNNIEYGDVSQGWRRHPNITLVNNQSQAEQAESGGGTQKDGASDGSITSASNQSSDPDGDTPSGVKYLLKNRDEVIAQRRAFFQREGQFLYQDFLKLVRDQKKSAALVAEKAVVDYFSKNDIISMVTESDKTTKSLTKSYVQYHDFVFSSFTSFKDYLSASERTEDETKKVLLKMNKRIGKVLKSVKSNAVVMVVLSGRTDRDGDHNATCFVKVVI